MLFFAGIFFVVISIIVFVTLFRNSRRPRIDGAKILELSKEPYKFSNSQRKLPHALVEYELKGTVYQKKILLHSKSAIGDIVSLYVDSNRPDDVEQYYPSKQIIVALVIAAIGGVMMISSLIISDII